MAFRDLDEYLGDGALRLPVAGRTWVIPSPSAEDGLRMQAQLSVVMTAVAGGQPSEADAAVLDDAQELDLYQRALSPEVFAQMRTELTWAQLSRCGITAFLFWAAGEQQAMRFWEGGDSGEAAAPRPRSKGKGKSTASRGSHGSSPTTARKTTARLSAGTSSSSTGA